jgi:hypothetical protein
VRTGRGRRGRRRHDDGLRVAGMKALARRRVVPGRPLGIVLLGLSGHAVPLNTVPAEGGDWVNVFDPVLPYVDFELVRSAARLPAAATRRRAKEPDRVRAAGLAVREPVNDFTRSWIWPACSPAASGSSRQPHRTFPGRRRGAGSTRSGCFHRQRRSLPAHGGGQRSVRGSSVVGRCPLHLVVRRGSADSPGALLLLRFDRPPARLRAPGPVARIGPAPGENGHADWSNRVIGTDRARFGKP